MGSLTEGYDINAGGSYQRTCLGVMPPEASTMALPLIMSTASLLCLIHII